MSVWCVRDLITTQNTLVTTQQCSGNHPEHPSNYSNTLEQPSNVLATTQNTLETRSNSSLNCTWLFLSIPVHASCLCMHLAVTPKVLFSLKTHYLFILRSILLPSHSKHIFYLFKTHFPLNSGSEGLG